MISCLRNLLLQTKDDEPLVKEVKDWLCGRPLRDDFLRVHDPPIPFHVLDEMLRTAVMEIILTIDTELEQMIVTVKDPVYCIHVDEDSFWGKRQLNMTALRNAAITSRFTYEQMISALEATRNEIAFLDNEYKRLLMHKEIAKEQVRKKWRTSFVFRALPRGGW